MVWVWAAASGGSTKVGLKLGLPSPVHLSGEPSVTHLKCFKGQPITWWDERSSHLKQESPFLWEGGSGLLVTVNKWDSTLSIGSVALGTPWVKYLRSLLLEEKQTWVCWEVNCVLCQELVIWLQTSGEILFSLYPVYLSLYKVFEVKFCSQVSSQELWGPKSLSSQRQWGFSEKLFPLPIFTVPG